MVVIFFRKCWNAEDVDVFLFNCVSFKVVLYSEDPTANNAMQVVLYTKVNVKGEG